MMASKLNDEVIERLDDLDDAVDLLEELNINCEGIIDIEDARQRLYIYLHNPIKAGEGGSTDKYKIASENSARIIQHLMGGSNTVRQKLQDLVKRCHEVVRKVPTACLAELNNAYPEVLEKLEKAIKNLDRNECILLVAGETGAGKSTLLNLLLGELITDLLPVAHLSSTSAICELKYGEDKAMTVYPRDPAEKAKTINIDTNAAKIISHYVHQKGDRSTSFAYNKVVVYWPCEWLKGGITIVDSPGVGEDTELTELVKQYMPKAFGFIYVINTPNAGGIDPERLQDLIFSHLAVHKKAASGQLNPRSAVFVCNKWDSVPFEQRQKVKNHVFTELHETWPGFTEDQVFFMSAKVAKEQLHCGVVGSDYHQLLQGIERLIPVGVNNRLCLEYATCLQIMDRCQLILQTYMSGLLQTNKQTKEQVQQHLEKLMTEPEALQSKLKGKLESLSDQALERLKVHLLDPETVESLSDWSETECKPLISCNSLDILSEKMRARISKRIKTEIKDWDVKYRLFEIMHHELLSCFKKDFQFMETERRQIEQNFVSGTNEALKKMVDEITTQPEVNESAAYSFGWNLAVDLAAPVLVPIGYAVGLFSIPFAGLRARYNQTLQATKLDLQQKMADLTKTMLREMTEEKGLSKILEERLSGLMSFINAELQNIPVLIKADQQMLINLEKEQKCTAEEFENQYRLLLNDTDYIIRQLNVLYINKIRTYDFEFQNLENMQFVCEGIDSRMHKAQLHRGKESTISVIVKAMIDPISNKNVGAILTEEEKMRAMQDSNIIKFYGTCMQQNGDNTFTMLVMEFCEETFDQVIFGTSYNAPGRDRAVSAIAYEEMNKTAANFAQQIASGLNALHQHYFPHRKLTPENIYVKRDGNTNTILLKLAVTALMHGRKTSKYGFNLHIAPEVKSDRTYTEKSDMFSYGMVLWELWNGVSIESVTKVNSHQEFFGYALSSTKMHSVWKELMEQCWDLDPEKRPKAHHCCKQFKNLYAEKQSHVKH